tara:strand:- start:433 stop:753 length:321 start_codon:yes stop_codon:yes gene_type:complete
MDKKLQSDLYGFFCKEPKIWDKILIEDTHRLKGEIGSCCSSHALEQFVTFYFPKLNDLSVESQIKAIKPGLDEDVLSAIAFWKCDDDEHNEYIQEILDIAKKEMKN